MLATPLTLREEKFANLLHRYETECSIYKIPAPWLVEVVELPEHPWYVGCQFHPEFKSRPDRPHPLFTGFVAAALEKK